MIFVNRIVKKFNPKHLLTLLILALLYLSPTHTVLAETYTVGIVPQQASAIMARKWLPLLNYLTQNSHIELSFKTAPTIPEFEKRLQQGEYDFAYMNPYHYAVMFSQNPGYQVLAHEKNLRLQGILVVRKDSPITDIKQLDGTDLAFPAPAAFAASILPRLELKKQGIHIQPYFVASHDSVYIAVARNFFPAGGGILKTFEMMPSEIRDQLRILWRTELYTPHAFAAHPRVTPEVRKALTDVMVAMDSDPTAMKILSDLGMKGWQVAVDSDWDDLRKLPLNLQ